MLGSKLFELQMKLMKLLNIDSKAGTMSTTGKASSEELGAAIGISVEAGEILEIISNANRVWKKSEPPYAHMKEELTDVVFFVLELAILLGITQEEMEVLYMSKYKKNLIRLYKATKDTHIVKDLIMEMSLHFTDEELKEIYSS